MLLHDYAGAISLEWLMAYIAEALELMLHGVLGGHGSLLANETRPGRRQLAPAPRLRTGGAMGSRRR